MSALADSRPVELRGVQKAAVLLVQLGKERAARVIEHLDGPILDELVAEIVRLQAVGPELASQVLTEFHAMAQGNLQLGGGTGYAQAMLETSFGAEEASAVMRRVARANVERPLAFLHEADAQQVATILRGEHPQTVAVVLSYLRPEQASLILSGLSAADQAEAARRLATRGRVHYQVLRLLADTLMARTSAVLQPSRAEEPDEGVKPLVDILNRADRATERAILEGLDATDSELAEQVRSQLFVFEDITSLEDRAIQLVLRQVDTNDLATALKGVTTDVRDRVLSNVSERARNNLVDEIDLLGAVRMSAVEEAQARIVQVIRSLEESGQLELRRSGDDEYVS